jgi:oligoendopeptidase F
MNSKSRIQPLIELANKIEERSTDHSKRNWTYYTTGDDFRIEDSLKKIKEIYKDKNNFDLIRSFQDKNLNHHDKRCVELLFNSFEPYHLSKELNDLDERISTLRTKLSGVLNTHRSTIDGVELSSNDISKMVSTSPVEKVREKAWRSRAQVNKPLVDGGFIELLNLRKEYASLSGAKDFTTMELERNELNPSLFSGWDKQLKEVLPSLKKDKQGFANEFLQKETLEPWDERYISNQICSYNKKEVNMIDYYSHICDLYKKFDFDLTKQNITFDVFPRKNKSEWGYQFTVELGRDCRILANIDNQYINYNVLLHEAGHANHYNNVNAKDTIINWGISGIISEGLANLFGGMQLEEIFYSKFFKGKNAIKEFERLKNWRKKSSLSSIETILFDQELYRRDLKSLDDINQLNIEYMKELGTVDSFTGEPPWGFLIHHTTHPIYLHNYFMGDVACEMFKKVFTRDKGVNSIFEDPKGFGNFLKEKVIHPSGLDKFEDLFRNISGEDFSIKYIL